jgi:DUF4097 and DUF4098 domain-containing protein YvlB
MKTVKISILFFAMILLGGGLSAQSTSTQQLVIPLSEPGKPFVLDAHIFHGSIKVTSYEGKEVIIDVQADTSGKRKNMEGNGMKRIPSGGGLDVNAEEENNTVRLNAGMSRRLVGLSIKVPRESGKFKLGTVEEGNIVVTNVNGELEINNINGNVTLTGISGSVVASTISGNLTVTFKTIDPKAPMAFSNMSGKIDVTFPADLKADMKLKTDQNGEIYTDFDIPADQTELKLNKTSEGHMYKVNIDNWVKGKINGGGQEIMMKSFSGDIYIRKAGTHI